MDVGPNSYLYFGYRPKKKKSFKTVNETPGKHSRNKSAGMLSDINKHDQDIHKSSVEKKEVDFRDAGTLNMFTQINKKLKRPQTSMSKMQTATMKSAADPYSNTYLQQ